MLPLLDDKRPYAERVIDPADPDRECYWLHLTEAQAEALASGYVSGGVKSVLRELIDFELEMERRAARPVYKEKKVVSRVAKTRGDRKDSVPRPPIGVESRGSAEKEKDTWKT